MKALKLFLAALAAAALAACSKSENLTTAESSTDNADARYMAVTISMGTTTKADDDYEPGSEVECGVNTDNSGFLFYDASGNYVTYGEFSGEFGSSSNNGIDKETDATIILGPTATTPSQVIAIFNYSEWKNFIGSSLSTVQAKTSVIPSSLSASGDFVMASAGLLSGESCDTYSVATAIEDKNICSSESDAKGSPVTIYVERQVAKVKITTSTSSEGETHSGQITGTTNYYADLSTSYSYIDWDSVEGKTSSNAWVRVNITGWGLNATNSTAYILKNGAETEYSGPGWYDTNTYSYLWAKDVNYEYVASDTYGDDATGAYSGVSYVKYSDLSNCNTDATYTMENTVNEAGQEASSSSVNTAGYPALTPTVALAAYLSLDTSAGSSFSNANVNSDNNTDLYINSGIIFTKDGLIATALEELTGSGYYADASSTTALTPDDITVALDAVSSATTNSCIYQVSSVEIKSKVYKDGTEITETDDLTTDLNSTSYLKTGTDSETSATTGLKYYFQGKCYYQAVIEHKNAAEAVTLKGIVRNHSYVITLGTISGIGGPVSKDSDKLIIIPGQDEANYLAATVNILKWISQSQTVKF